MKLEHFGMAEPGDCRLVFTASAEERATRRVKQNEEQRSRPPRTPRRTRKNC